MNRSCLVVMFVAAVGCGPSIDDLDDFNLPPSVYGQFVTTDENVAVTIDPLAHASDYDSDPLTVSAVSAPTGHTATLVGNRSIRVTPMKDFTGTFTVTWSVSDGTHHVVGEADVFVTAVYGSPNPVIALGGSVTVAGTTTITLTATGGNQALWQFSILSGPGQGTVTGTPPVLSYTPQQGAHGDDFINYQVSDGGSTASAILTIHVLAQPGLNAFDNSFSGPEDSPLNLYLNADGSPLTYSIVGTPAHGTLSGTAPNLTYTPAANFNGPDSMTFSVSDGTSTSRVATVSIFVQAMNDAPTASPQTVRVTEDISRDIVLVGNDIDGDFLSYTVTTNPAHGALLGFAPNLTYRPAANYHGTDSFTFRVSDWFTDSAPATVSITIDSVEDLPIAEAFARSLAEDTAAPLTLLGSDGDGDPISYAFTQPAHGTLTGTAPALTYTPAANFSGTDSFTYTVAGDGIVSAPATVTLTVTPVNDPPVASNGEVTTAEDTKVTIALQASDIDSPALSFSITVPPVDGTLSGFGPSWTYTPAHNATGDRSFTFRVTDGNTGATGVVTIHITPADDPPTAVDDFVTTQPGMPITFSVTANDSDPEGDPFELDSVEAPAHGNAQIVDGKITYTPDAGFTATDVFSYTVVDSHGASSNGTAHVGVGVYPPGAPSETIAVGSVQSPAISLDDRYIAFDSSAALVPSDTNGVTDVYLYDRGSRSLTQVSTSSAGDQGNGPSSRPQLSADGRYIVFESTATNLVLGDGNGVSDVFRHDRITGETVRISVATGGRQGTGASVDGHISEDGNLIAFASSAFELVDNDANGVSDIFVRDVAAGTTIRISVSTIPGDADQASTEPAISGDGRFVVFSSLATNLVTGDTNGMQDVFLRDRNTGTTARMNVTSTAGQGNGAASGASLSRDGRFVAFLSNAANLVSPATTATQLLVHDNQAQTTTRPLQGAALVWARLSGDGAYVTGSGQFFPSTAFITHRFTGTMAKLPAAINWFLPVLSSSGRYLVVIDTSNNNTQILVVPNPL